MPSSKDSQSNVPIDENYYEVQQILKRKTSTKGVLYLVKWKGWDDPKDYTWEPMQHLDSVKELIEDFNSKEHDKFLKLKEKNQKHKDIEKVKKKEEGKAEQKRKMEDEQEESDSDRNREKESKVEEEQKQIGLGNEGVKKRGRKKGSKNQLKQQKTHGVTENQEASMRIAKLKKERERKNQEQANMEEQARFDIGINNKLGKINYHILVNNELMLEVEILNAEDYVINTTRIPSADYKKICKRQLSDYYSSCIEDALRANCNSTLGLMEIEN